MASIPEFLTQALQAQYGETLAAQILAVSDEGLAAQLDAMKEKMTAEVVAKDQKLQEEL